jgi:Tfp pilus assembly protein PilZ
MTKHCIIEQRKFKRFDLESLNLIPKAFFPNDPYPYQVVNLSFIGLFIKNKTNYKKGQIIDIELEIPAIGKIPMCVEIIWINHSEPNGMGVKIIEIPQQYKKIWAQFIKICYILSKLKEEYQKLQNEKVNYSPYSYRR